MPDRLWEGILTAPHPIAFLSSMAPSSPHLTTPDATSTLASDINNAGQIVGGYLNCDGIYHGFLKDGANFTTIDYGVDYAYRCGD